MDFITFVILELAGGIPAMIYYYYWGVLIPQRGIKKEERWRVLHKVEMAYIFNALTTVYILGLLVYFLYVNIAAYSAGIFINIALLMLFTAVGFELVNYFAFERYERKKLLGV
ncbi:MAG: hypothetical protein ABIG20_04210 [archaeon]